MAWNPTDDDVKGRIDDLEAMVNGLMIYIAAKEEGLALNSDSDAVKAFLRGHVMRPRDARLQQHGAMAGEGFWDGLALGKIPQLRKELRDAGLA